MNTLYSDSKFFTNIEDGEGLSVNGGAIVTDYYYQFGSGGITGPIYPVNFFEGMVKFFQDLFS